MHNNLIWRAFLIITGLVACWYTAVAVYRYHQYERLNAHTSPTHVEWKIIQQDEEAYTLEGVYAFEVEGTQFQGMAPFPENVYVNMWGAEHAVKERTEHPPLVWYETGDPSYSSLEKSFPFKAIFSALVLVGLLLYFVVIGYYVGRFKTGI